MKLSVEQHKALIPDAEVRRRHLDRPDIRMLPAVVQEQRWQQHLQKLDALRERLATLDSCEPLPSH